MAEQLTTRRGRPPKYPWKKWMTPDTLVEFTRGMDFYCEPHAFALQVRRKANELGLPVSVYIKGDIVKAVIGS